MYLNKKKKGSHKFMNQTGVDKNVHCCMRFWTFWFVIESKFVSSFDKYPKILQKNKSGTSWCKPPGIGQKGGIHNIQK